MKSRKRVSKEGKRSKENRSNRSVLVKEEKKKRVEEKTARGERKKEVWEKST